MAILNSEYGTIDREEYGNLGSLNFKRFKKLANPLNSAKRMAILSNPVQATMMRHRSTAMKGAFMLRGIEEDEESGLGKFSFKKLVDPREGLKRTKKLVKNKKFQKVAAAAAVAVAAYYTGGAALKLAKAHKLATAAKVAKAAKNRKRGNSKTLVANDGSEIISDNTSGYNDVVSAGGAPFATTDTSDYSGSMTPDNTTQRSKNQKSGGQYSNDGYATSTSAGDYADDSGSPSMNRSIDQKTVMLGGGVVLAAIAGYFLLSKRGR